MTASDRGAPERSEEQSVARPPSTTPLLTIRLNRAFGPVVEGEAVEDGLDGWLAGGAVRAGVCARTPPANAPNVPNAVVAIRNAFILIFITTKSRPHLVIRSASDVEQEVCHVFVPQNTCRTPILCCKASGKTTMFCQIS